ncbi:unnamed protein product [Adineta steineri]|uniref:LITAF domain-containing protein n=1 Tax=Adineta steineri TaxID=433720 RepID=A0A815IMC8_9BILA|nr:unnamed protein product [Adineta steineri]CAF3707539.1 unnamed protein product [Adineta steineri]
MQSYEDAPPPYPGATSNVAPNIVTSKGDYRGVPVYEIGSNDMPVYGQTTYQPASYQQSPYQQAPVMMSGPTVIQAHAVKVGHNPVHCICPQCHQQIVTRVDYDSGSFAWLMCLLLTVIGCVPCCVIPFCATSCQDATHTCPHCSAMLGRRNIL